MDPQAILLINLLTNTLIFALALLVYSKNPRHLSHQLFAILVLSFVIWSTGVSLAYFTTESPGLHLFRAKIVFASASVAPLSFLLFCAVFPSASYPKNLTPMFAAFAPIAAIFLFLSFSTLIVADVTHSENRIQLVYGPLHKFFGLYVYVTFASGLTLLLRKLKKATGLAKLQLRYFSFGVLIAVLGGTTTNLLIPLVFHTSRFSGYGPIFTMIMIMMTAHAIIRYRLMDIRVVIKKGAVLLFALLVLGLMLFLVGKTAYAVLPHQLEPMIVFFVILTGLAVGVSLQPVKRFIETMTDRYVYRPVHDRQQILGKAIRGMSAILDFDALLTFLGSVVLDSMNAETSSIYLASDGGFSRVFFNQPIPSDNSMPPTNLALKSRFIERIKSHPEPLVREEISRRVLEPKSWNISEELAHQGWDLALPMTSERKLIGLLCLGPKLSGDPYFPDDIELLSTIANQAGIAIKNAQLYREVTLANRYIENILTTMHSGVIAVSADRNISLFNPAAERMTGRSAKEVRSRPMDYLPAELAVPLAATLADGQSRIKAEILLPNTARHLTPIACSTSALLDSKGNTHGAVVVFSNLSQLKELESEKRRTEHLASIGALASGIAHEIKNPLVAITTFAELLPERFADEDFRGDFSKVVLREIERIDDLVARLRGLATLPTQTLSPLDLRGPIEETLALLRGQLEQSRITVKRVYQREVPLVLGDAARLKQLFLNLFINALEAMQPSGELAIRLASEEALDKHILVVEVSDTGMGIPETLQGEIFEPFVTTKPRGSGLGLSICRGIVDSHHGTIRIRNNANGKGTTIAVQFQLAQQVPAAAEAS